MTTASKTWVCDTCGEEQHDNHLVDLSGGLGWGKMNSECVKCERKRKNLPRIKRIVECGCCGCYHPEDFMGDCRDDQNRFACDEDFEERMGYAVQEVWLDECDEDGNPPPIDEQDDSDFDNPHDDLSDK